MAMANASDQVLEAMGDYDDEIRTVRNSLGEQGHITRPARGLGGAG